MVIIFATDLNQQTLMFVVEKEHVLDLINVNVKLIISNSFFLKVVVKKFLKKGW